MKKFIFFAHVYTWLLAILPVASAAQNLDVYPNYVVIGAFEHKKNAVFFTDDANQHNFSARFEMNPNRNLYYVYVLTTDDREHAFAEALKLRTDTKYFDTWVYSGLLASASLPNTDSQDQDINPTTGEQILSVSSDQRGKGDPALRDNIGNSGVDVNESGNENLRSTSSDRERTQSTRTGGSTKENQAELSGLTRKSQNPALQTNGQKKDASNIGANDAVNKSLTSTSSDFSDRGQKQQARTGGTTKENQTELSGSTRESQNSALQTNGQKKDASNVGANDAGNKNLTSTSSELSDRERTQSTGTGGSTKANQTELSGSTRESQNSGLETNDQKQDASNVDSNDAGNRNLASTASELSDRGQKQQARTGGTTKENQTELSGSTHESQNPTLQTSGQKQDASQINSHQTASPDQSGAENKSGVAKDAKQKQVTITRADGTSVVARTANGSNDLAGPGVDSKPDGKNSSTGLPSMTSDQTKDTNASTENTKDTDVPADPAGKSGSQIKKNAVANADGLPLNADNKSNPAVTGPPPIKVSTQPLSAEEVAGKNFYFYLFRADNHNMVGGEVDGIDFERSRRMATYPANTQVKVIMPSGKSKQISFVCQVFGYRKLQKEFKPDEPAEDMYLDDKGNVVVPFELMRLQKGDIAIMYNVFFFKDAAVMRPESRYEVNNLLQLLQENPSYKIRIHGHTNGNAAGKIIYMDQPGNFYSLSNTRQGGGSAKKLSEERALVIREYLISSGISAERMQVQAWGGKKPIHDKNSARAHENVRVEIEILSE